MSESSSMRWNGGIIRIDAAVLIEALGLPSGTRIHQVKSDWFTGRVVELVVDHPDLPENVQGSVPKLLNPSWRKDGDRVVFDSWGDK